MNKKGQSSIKFLFGIGAGGVCSLGALYGLYINSLLWTIGFLAMALLASLFVTGAEATSAAAFGIGTLLFGIQAKQVPAYGYGDMIWSGIFFLFVIGTIILKNLNS